MWEKGVPYMELVKLQTRLATMTISMVFLNNLEIGYNQLYNLWTQTQRTLSKHTTQMPVHTSLLQH